LNVSLELLGRENFFQLILFPQGFRTLLLELILLSTGSDVALADLVGRFGMHLLYARVFMNLFL
jgi:hypothetical protein